MRLPALPKALTGALFTSAYADVKRHCLIRERINYKWINAREYEYIEGEKFHLIFKVVNFIVPLFGT